MMISAEWKMSKDYFKSYWRDWIRTISKGRRWAVPLGLLSLIFWAIVYIGIIDISKNKELVLTILFSFGCFEIIWHFWEKYRWFSRMLGASDLNAIHKMVFSNKGVEITGPHSHGETDWKAFKNIIISKNGIFFVLQKGISIYVPSSALDTKDGESVILEMYNEGNT